MSDEILTSEQIADSVLGSALVEMPKDFVVPGGHKELIMSVAAGTIDIEDAIRYTVEKYKKER
jgi:hypothetical protein